MSYPLKLSPVVLCTACALLAALGCGGSQPRPATEPEATSAEEATAPQTPGSPFGEISLHVLTRCPHAAEMIRVAVTLKRELGDDLAIAFGLIGRTDDGGRPSPEVGDAEIESAKLMLCVGQSVDDAAWNDFLECVWGGETWRGLPQSADHCVERAGLDPREVSACAAADETDQLLGVTYAASEASGIEVSPTVFVGDTLYLGEADPATLREWVCANGTREAPRPQACGEAPDVRAGGATLLVDSRCGDLPVCDVSRELIYLLQRLPGLEIVELDYTTEDGRALYAKIQETGLPLSELPLLVFDTPPPATAGLGEFLVPFGDKALLAMSDGWDPTREICDNGVDDTGDGATDCADARCAMHRSCRRETKLLEVFIMSGCPFSAEMMPTLGALLDHFGRSNEAFRLRFDYIGGADAEGVLVSLHGPDEVAEDLRMICAQEIYPDDHAFFDYVACRARGYDSGDWQACIRAPLSAKKIAACAEGPRGQELLAESFERSAAAGVRGSPSVLVNGRFDLESRTLSALVEGFCEHNPSFACEKKISRQPSQSDDPSPRKCR